METNKGNILIVDDQFGNLKVLTDLLVKNGYKVRQAINGSVAINAAQSSLPDLILLDVLMPDMDGFTVCEHLKQNEKTKDIPVIFITILEDIPNKVKGFQVGGVDYITKPFQDEEVLARVNTHLKLRKMELDLKKKNRQLQTSEAQKTAILNGIKANIAFVDLDLKIIWANETAAKSVNRKVEEMIGLPCYKFWANPNKICDNCPSHKAIQTKKSEHFYMTTPDDRIWDERGEPVFDEDGKLIGIVEIALDVTDQKKMEQFINQQNKELKLLNEELVIAKDKAEEGERLFNQLLENSPIYIFLKDAELKTLKLSPNFAKMLGKPVNECLGKTMYELFPESFAKSIIDDDINILKNNKVIVVEEMLNERVYSTIKFPIHINGKPSLLGGFSIDITERKNAEQALTVSEQRFKGAFVSAAHGMALVAPNGKFLQINQAFCDIVGYTENEMLDTFFQNITHPDDLIIDLKFVDQLLANKIKSYQFEKRYFHKNGKIIWVLLSVSLVRNAEGEPVHFVSQAIDITHKKSAEQALIESEEKYRNLFQFMDEGFLRADKKGVINLANNAIAKMFDYSSPEEMLGMLTINLFADPDERAILMEELKINGKVDNYEILGTTKAQKKIWTLGNYKAIKNQNGEIIGTEGLFRDITDRKIAENALNEKIKELTFLFKLSEIVSNPVNSFETIFNQTINLIPFAMQYPEITYARISYLQNEYKSSNFSTTDYKIAEYLKEGDTILGFIEIGYLEDSIDNRKIEFLEEEKSLLKETALRLTKTLSKRLTEQALKESEEKFRKSLEFSPIPIAVAKNNGELILLNKQFTEVYGYNINEMPSIFKWFDLVYPDAEYRNFVINDWSNAVDFAVKNNAPTPIREYNVTCKNGKIKIVEISAFFEKEYSIGLFNDVTKQKKVEELIKQQNIELSKLNSDKDRFIKILAHDLRNPFNSLLGFSELLLERMDNYDKDELESQLKIINQTAHKTYHLLEDLLQWTNAQSGKLSFEPVALNIWEICNEQIEQIKNPANTKQISINSFQTDDIIVWADSNMLKTILRNLILNAVKFTNPRGTVNIYCKVADNYAVITISDNGIGIDKQNISKLWSITEKYTSAGTKGEKGSGFGLLLCKELIEKQGGIIWVESEIGKGSDFKFTLPLYK